MPKDLFPFYHLIIYENCHHIPVQQKELQGRFRFCKFVLLLNKFSEEVSIEIAYKLCVKT